MPRPSAPQARYRDQVCRPSGPVGSGVPDPYRGNDGYPRPTVASGRSPSVHHAPSRRGEACLTQPRQRRSIPPSRCRPFGPDGSRVRDPKGQACLTPTQKTATLQRRPSAVIAHGRCIVCGSVGARRASPSRTARRGKRHVRALRAGASAWERGLPALPGRTGQAVPDPAMTHLLAYAGLGGARHLFAPSHRMIRERQGSDHTGDALSRSSWLVQHPCRAHRGAGTAQPFSAGVDTRRAWCRAVTRNDGVQCSQEPAYRWDSTTRRTAAIARSISSRVTSRWVTARTRYSPTAPMRTPSASRASVNACAVMPVSRTSK